MNTRISVTKTSKNTDHLLILADKNDFAWTANYLDEAELTFLKRTADQQIPYAFIPQEKRYIIVQYLKDNATESYDKEDARVAGNDILTLLAHYKIKTLTLINQRKLNRIPDYVEGMVLGNYQFLKYFREKKDKANTLKTIKINHQAIGRSELQTLKAVLEATCIARDLVNEPQSYLSAATLSKEIINIGKEAGFTVKVFDKKKIEKLRMGGILAVNMGSMQPPRFNIMEWKPPQPQNSQPIVLVGKGIVYDTGGVSLKPTSNSMDYMKSDMAGAAAVIGAIAAVAKARLPYHLIALVPSTDNRPGNNAYVPGDVITMYDGSTVEILNTDAEGRLVLADALHYAKQYKPELVLDFATLTGSASRACGPEAIVYMGNAHPTVKAKIEQSGYSVYERLIEFPLWREYGEQIKSNIADLRNLGGSSAGMITAGKFLEYFTDYPWLHFDIAGPAYLKSSDSYRTKEGTGVGVRLIFDFLKHY
ncbi:MAG: peptidase M17 [Bacteroidota bacterium]